jgi:hypothetical protein
MITWTSSYFGGDGYINSEDKLFLDSKDKLYSIHRSINAKSFSLYKINKEKRYSDYYIETSEDKEYLKTVALNHFHSQNIDNVVQTNG